MAFYVYFRIGLTLETNIIEKGKKSSCQMIVLCVHKFYFHVHSMF